MTLTDITKKNFASLGVRKIKVIHLELKATRDHKYYGSLAALFKKNTKEVLGISKFTLDRYNFETPYENANCIIRVGYLETSGSED